MLQAIVMRCLGPALLITILIMLSSTSNSRYLGMGVAANNDGIVAGQLNISLLEKVLLARRSAQFVLGTTKMGRPVEAFYFPGTSSKRALVLGGMHGSELSSIEIAKTLIRQLANGDSIYYNVIVIPSLFPDNADIARQHPQSIGNVQNLGRYSFPGAVDPNRQMPTPGKPFDEDDSLDHAGRKIEIENALLLQLIGEYRPQRIANLHAIRNTANAGVFADPRTDHNGLALGFETDSSLAISIAKAIHQGRGYIPGNHLAKNPTALYHKDPTAVPAGTLQKRNFTGSPMPGHRGGGVSLGTWASTAIFNAHDTSLNRDAIRILTMEFPGCKRPNDYTQALKPFYETQIHLYASALKNIFLGEWFVEEQ